MIQLTKPPNTPEMALGINIGHTGPEKSIDAINIHAQLLIKAPIDGIKRGSLRPYESPHEPSKFTVTMDGMLKAIVVPKIHHDELFCTSSRVSSVLNKDVKQFGKKHLFDNQEETCWNSDQGSPQWIELELSSSVLVDSFTMQFQGGFTGKDCEVVLKTQTDPLGKSEPFYPEDVNSVQSFNLKEPVLTNNVRLVFNSSTDFFGRIVIYKLELLNHTSS
uniref:Nuclear receptor 2C2-associated protein n=1 Tax=Timema bartmani TaxID=61472 RepID=A0A7R9F9P2_9NEOP|nr:unnamed protein product [Timema bartmani]